MKKALKAMTEFCWNGVRYATGDIVPATGREAQKLMTNRLVYEVQGAAAEPPATEASVSDDAAKKAADDVAKKTVDDAAKKAVAKKAGKKK